MYDLPFPWDAYEEIQRRASCGDRITSRTWGMENGLNRILAAVETGAYAAQSESRQDIDRAIATGARVERHRAQLLRKYLRGETTHCGERRALARLRLGEVQNAVGRAGWELLGAAAAGVTCQDIANRLGISTGAVRTRLSRLRGRLRRGRVAMSVGYTGDAERAVG